MKSNSVPNLLHHGKGGCIQIAFVVVLTYAIWGGFSGCAELKIQEISSRPASDFKYSQRSSNVVVSVDPYTETERTKRYFGDDLLSRGILPVFAMVENHDINQPFIFDKGSFEIIMKTGSTNDSSRSIESSLFKEQADANQNNMMMKTISGASLLLAPISMFAFLPAMMIQEKDLEELKMVRHNMVKQKLVDRIVFPGESHGGFVYFLKANNDNTACPRAIRVRLRSLRTNDIETFYFELRN